MRVTDTFRFATAIAGVIVTILTSAESRGVPAPNFDADSTGQQNLNAYLTTAAEIKSRLYETPQARVRVPSTAGPPVDLMLHHGGAYSSREHARLEGRVRDGAVLILLDSHADLMDQVGLAPRSATLEEADRIEYDIASHIVPSLADGLINEIVHIGNRRLDWEGRLPAHVPRVRKMWVIQIRDATGVEAAVLLDGDRPTSADALTRIQPLLARREKLLESVLARTQPSLDRRRRSAEGLRVVGLQPTPVVVRTTFPDDLPDFSGDARSLLLDIDEDFFVLRPETEPAAEVDRAEVARDVEQTIGRLVERGIRPGSVSIALSPGYTPEDQMTYVTAALLAALEQGGVSRYVRLPVDRVALEINDRTGDNLPEIQMARAAAQAVEHDATRISEALALCSGVIDRHHVAASAQQRRGWARSRFVTTGNPEWPWQPSPVVVQQRELNGVAEAYTLRAMLFVQRQQYKDALQDLFTVDEHYSDAYQPVSIRQFSKAAGWIVGHGWEPRTSQQRTGRLLQVLASLLLRAGALEREPFYRAWTAGPRDRASEFLSDVAELGQSDAIVRHTKLMEKDREALADGSDVMTRMLAWLSATLETERRAFRARMGVR